MKLCQCRNFFFWEPNQCLQSHLCFMNSLVRGLQTWSFRSSVHHCRFFLECSTVIVWFLPFSAVYTINLLRGLHVQLKFFLAKNRCNIKFLFQIESVKFSVFLFLFLSSSLPLNDHVKNLPEIVRVS